MAVRVTNGEGQVFCLEVPIGSITATGLFLAVALT